LAALTGGYHLAFVVGAVFAAGAATIGATLLREGTQARAHAGHDQQAGALANAE